MAAGQGFKTFATGDILTAADTNGYLMSQTVMVFADSTARTAAIASPQQGMVTFLKGTNSTEYYNGSAWVAIGGGSTSPLTTKGDVWGYSTTNARIPVGTNGQVLTADSTQALGVKWAGAGKVLQVVNVPYGTYGTTTSSTYASTGLTASITPSASTSKVLVMVNASGLAKIGGDTGIGLRLYRGGSSISQFEGVLATNGGSAVNGVSASTTYLDSPATTSSTTYTVYWNSYNNSSQCRINNDNGTAVYSTITLLEIGA